jgi:glycosyltransferase involved in cell wall biosynthesis
VRIALFPSAYAPAVGGVEELTARLARHLVEGGDEVEVWTIRHPASLYPREEIDEVTVRRFDLPLPRLGVGSLLSLPLGRRRALRSLATAAAEFRPDLVHVQCFSANGVYAARFARQHDVPLVVSLQGETVMDDHDIYERSLTLRVALRRALRSAGAVTACSRFVLTDAEERFGLRAGAGRVIPNGVELDEAIAPRRFELPFERFVLGLGRVVAKKGFDLLLDAFMLIASEQPELGLVIGGDGPQRAALLRRAAEAGLEHRVVLTGTLGRPEVEWAMASAEVFVLPSRIEPFGIVVLEALRAGCPAIVSPHGGATEIVRDGVDGLVADPDKPGELARALNRVLGDASLAARLREAGRARSAAFGWEEIAGRYRALYDDVVVAR